MKLGRLVLAVLLGSALALAGCASSQSSGAAEEASGTSTTKSAQGVAPPPGSKLAKVALGMSDSEVRDIMGSPTGQTTYQTGKAWIPYYYGSDTHRTDWKYAGQGRVVFGHNRYSGNTKVIRIDYDPEETGN